MEVFAPSRIVIAKGKIAQHGEIVAGASYLKDVKFIDISGDSKTILFDLVVTWELKH